MIAIIKRNLTIYSKNISNIFFSLLGSLIFFLIYIFFLRSNILSDLGSLPNKSEIIDMWMLGALLTITSLTTAFTISGQYVIDKTNNKFLDFKISQTAPATLLFGYYLSSFFLSFITQIIIFIVAYGYFYSIDALTLHVEQLGYLGMNFIISSLLSSGITFLICAFIKTESSLRGVGTIIGAASGFIIGGYVPMGNLSDTAQTFIKCVPLTYSGLENRWILVTPYLEDLPTRVTDYMKEFLGISLEIGSKEVTQSTVLWILLGSSAIIILIILLLSKRLMKSNLKG